MALPRRNTKELASRYRGNLDYNRKAHPFRTAKLIFFVLAALGSLALAFRPHKATLFSTGPISANHASFADRCEVCHEGAQPSLWHALSGSKMGADGQLVSQSFGERAKATWASLTGGNLPAHVTAGLETTLTASNSLGALDTACLKCHEPMKLHQPQAMSLGLRPIRTEISAAEVASCSSCHREHEGPAKMKDPPSSNCTDCHGSFERLKETLVTYKVQGGHPPPTTGTVQDFKKDGVRRFAPPRQSPHQPAVFTGFAAGHPSFGYEQPGVRDPAALSFNHSRHFQKDIPPVNGKKLACVDCHRPGADGAFMQPVKYALHCQQCHSLNFAPDLPTLTIPHGDPEKVRDSLTSAGLTVLFQDFAVREKKLMELTQQQQFITEQFQKLKDRGIDTTEKLLLRAFRTGDPPNAANQFFPGCAKCHVVNGPVGGATPTIQPTNTADRWLTRGPFNHAPHQHMACEDCHSDALTSTHTTDILLPSQASCAECHRPLDVGPQKNNLVVAFQTVESVRLNPQLVKQQREQGGISNECQYCHPRYHASADATVFTKTAVRVK